MKSDNNKILSVDEYIKSHPEEIKDKLIKIREAIKKAAPGAKEIISYQMPAYKLHTNLVYFAAFKNHIGFFPTSGPIKEFKKELESYETSKGTIKFPLNKKIPLGLVTKITKYRVREDFLKHFKQDKKKKEVAKNNSVKRSH
jgi:uncharacterized protein YdhG (YjbR/CyaY superfamily)